jgi:DNA-binding winged helix-turn-helix (wHTH) protein
MARFCSFYWKVIMQRTERTNPRQFASGHNPKRWAAMKTNADAEPALWRQNPLLQGANRSSPAIADAALEFGRFRVLLRQRQLLADGVPVELGTRAFDLLLALLEADGVLVSKEELLSRVWPGIVVSEENLKVQISALRKALGTDRDIIRTEFGRGYRFTGVLCSNAATDECQRPTRAKLRSAPTLSSPVIPGSSPGRGGVGRGPQNCWHSFRCNFSLS